LGRSSLHRCLQHHDIARLPDTTGDIIYPISDFHIGIDQAKTAESKPHVFVAIDQTSKFAFVRLEKKTNRVTASVFLVARIKSIPYKTNTVLTDNGIQFTFPPHYVGRLLPLSGTCSTCAAKRIASRKKTVSRIG
jgi:hypothetical protein